MKNNINVRKSRKNSLLAAVFLSCAVALSFGSTAYAEDPEDQTPEEAIAFAGITMNQAITIAEQNSNGKALEAGFSYSDHEEKWVYNVEVVGLDGTNNVKIAADDGTIISTEEDDD